MATNNDTNSNNNDTDSDMPSSSPITANTSRARDTDSGVPIEERGPLFPHVNMPHAPNCQGCQCRDVDDIPMYSDRTHRVAQRLQVPQEAVDIYEEEGSAYGLTTPQIHAFITSEREAADRGSVRLHIIRTAAQAMPLQTLRRHLEAKEDELAVVEQVYLEGPRPRRDVVAPRIMLEGGGELDPTTPLGRLAAQVLRFPGWEPVGDGAEQELADLFRDPNYLRTQYALTTGQFTTYQLSAVHHGLSNAEMHNFLSSGRDAVERGLVEIWALRRRVEGLGREERRAEVERRSVEVRVLREVVGTREREGGV